MIKDQCNNCKYSDSDQCQSNQVYDGTSCDSYAKQIDLEKHTASSTQQADHNDATSIAVSESEPVKPLMDGDIYPDEELPITSEYLKETTSIHGWLSFFLFVVGFGGLISAIYPIATFNIREYDGVITLAAVDVFMGLAYLFVAGYTIYSFVRREPNAVFVAKMYVVIILLSNVLQLIGGEFEENGLGSLKQVIRGISWGIIWFLYLCNSQQVKEIIPKSFRRRKSFDYYLLGGIIIIPIFLFAIGLTQIFSERNAQRSSMIEQTELSVGEYTDGIAVISCPEGFEIESNDVAATHNQTIKVFSLESDFANMTICSDFDSDFNKKNFLSYWQNWKDDDLKSYNEHIEIDDERMINGNSCFYRSVRYEDGENELAWRYVMIANRERTKITIVSSYDGYPEYEYGPNSYIQEFISNIRFE